MLALVFEHPSQAHERTHLECANRTLTFVHALSDLFVVESFEEFHDNDLLLVRGELAQCSRQQVSIQRTCELNRGARTGQFDRAIVIVERGGWFLAANMVDMRVVSQAI